jgi:hypothetical protein
MLYIPSMKKILFSLFLLASTSFCLQAQELTTFGGYHTQLFGYTDNRYVDADKGDYLKSLAWYAGSEFIQHGFQTAYPESAHVVLGAALLLYEQAGFSPKDLYQVVSSSVNIAAQTVPANLKDRSAKFQFTASGFGGWEDEWWGAEGGLSVFVKGSDETVRLMYAADGTVVNGPGRGWVFGDGSLILPNFKLRFGTLTLPHFTLALFRGNYDPNYGALQALVTLPFSPSFALQAGGSFFQTSSLFVEPMVTFDTYTVSVRAGTILNYNDAAFTRVGIFEGAFLSGSLGVRW